MPNLRDKTLNHMATLCRIMSILFIFVSIICALAFFIGVILFAAGAFGYQFLTTNGGWNPSEPGFSQRELVTEGVTLSLFAALALTSYLIAFKMFRSIAKTRHPFERARARELKGIAWVNIACAILPAIAAAVVSTLGFGNPYIPEDFGIDYDTLFNAIILITFAYIFDYGCALQQQDDELL